MRDMNWFKRKPPPPSLVYAPKDDITAQELSQVLKVFAAAYYGIGPEYPIKVWHALPDQSRRHFYLRENV